MKIQTVIGLVAIGLTGAAVCWAGLSAYKGRVLPLSASGTVYSVERAMELYAEAGGAPLTGKSHKEVVAALQDVQEEGEADYFYKASRELDLFAVIRKDPPNSTENIAVDVWENELRIAVAADGSAKVTSAGPNGIHGDDDDIDSSLARATIATEEKSEEE